MEACAAVSLVRCQPRTKGGGGRGNPLMPLFFDVGQHLALVAMQERLEANRISTTSTFYLHSHLAGESGCCICCLAGGTFLACPHSDGGTTQVWNAAGIEPPAKPSRRHECGLVQTSPHTVKKFLSWVLLWDIRIT